MLTNPRDAFKGQSRQTDRQSRCDSKDCAMHYMRRAGKIHTQSIGWYHFQ